MKVKKEKKVRKTILFNFLKKLVEYKMFLPFGCHGHFNNERDERRWSVLYDDVP